MIETLRSLALAGGHADMPLPERRMDLSDFDAVLDQMNGGAPSYTGKQVSQQTALQVATAWACISIKSNDLAKSPLLTYAYTDQGQNEAKGHYLWPILYQEANPEMPAFRFKRLMQVWLMLWGNAYAEIELSGRGQVVGLWPWRPDRVQIQRLYPGGPLFYRYRMDDRSYTPWIPRERMLHIRGLEIDGNVGLSPVQVHRQTLGLSMAIQEHGARFFSNGARPLGILQHPGKIDETALKNLKETWQNSHGGLTNAHRTAILEEGLTYKEAGLNMVEAQFAELIGLTNLDICRIYTMPPHKVADLTRATFSNIEQQGMDYVQSSLSADAANWESEIEYSCLSIRERESIFVKYDLSELQQGDMQSQAEYWSTLGDHGYVTTNEGRRKLKMNALPGKLANTPWRQMAMMPVGGDELPVKPDPATIHPPAPPKQKANGAIHPPVN